MSSFLGQINSLLDYLPAISLPKKKSLPSVTAVAPRTSSIGVDMSPIVRIAGLSGALAVAFGAYGGHKVRDDPSIEVRRKNAMAAGSQYHLIHTLALVAAPRARYPWVTAAIFIGGIVMFCGPCYHYSITGNDNTRKFAPIGGALFILGWLTFIL